MKRLSICLVLGAVCVAAAAGAADVMVVKKREHKGTFEGFHKNKFYFRTAGGGNLKKARGQVTKIVLEKPREVSVLLSRKKQTETKLLVKYDKRMFTFKEDGKNKNVFASGVKEISVAMAAPAGPGGVQRGGGAGAPEATYDVAPLEQRDDLTEAQTAALQRYKAAKQKYRDFLNESSAIVARMDQTKGARREELLNILRTRKNDEQPILNELRSATAVFERAFPDLVKAAE
jgi:hypothetical protein